MRLFDFTYRLAIDEDVVYLIGSAIVSGKVSYWNLRVRGYPIKVNKSLNILHQRVWEL